MIVWYLLSLFYLFCQNPISMLLAIAAGVLLFIALVYQTVVIIKGRTAYKKRAALYNMAIGVAVSYVLAWVIGKNAVGNGIGTGAISIGHLYMFTMFYADMPKERSNE